jgi:hypothetical protein
MPIPVHLPKPKWLQVYNIGIISHKFPVLALRNHLNSCVGIARYVHILVIYIRYV